MWYPRAKAGIENRHEVKLRNCEQRKDFNY